VKGNTRDSAKREKKAIGKGKSVVYESEKASKIHIKEEEVEKMQSFRVETLK